MSTSTPYAMLVGTWKFWVAAASTAIPNLDASPGGSWSALGFTNGEQTFSWVGALTALYNNDHTGIMKHVRPSEGFTVGAKLTKLTLEDMARVLSQVTGDITTTTSGALAVKELPLRRGYNPNRYALLARGGALEASNTMSAYGAWPAQLYIPQGVFGGEPGAAFGKETEAGIDFVFNAEVDESQSAGLEFGYLQMQSSA